VLGLERRALEEPQLLARINVGDRPAFLKALSDGQRNGDGAAEPVRMLVHGHGPETTRQFSMNVRRAEDVSAGHGAVVIVLRDITEQRAADDLRETARREAETIAKSKSQFLATMSHELRTPLNAIIGFSDLLLQPDLIPADDPRREEYARIINGSGQHLLEVVNAILDMSKIEAGMMTVEQERVTLPSVIESSAQFLAVKAADKQVSLEVTLAADLPDIVCDRRALKQILLNLLSNAVKFTPGHGSVAVTAVRDRDDVEIVVSDTGCGISEVDLASLGQPFFQARQAYDRQHEGTGLGLSVVRGLIGLLGGSLAIESAAGQGTRVALRLPVAGSGLDRSREPVAISTRVRLPRPALERLNHHAPAGLEPAARMTG
jgi:two-component system, cell cycle sensor histidine kinase DivJ